MNPSSSSSSISSLVATNDLGASPGGAAVGADLGGQLSLVRDNNIDRLHL